MKYLISFLKTTGVFISLLYILNVSAIELTPNENGVGVPMVVAKGQSRYQPKQDDDDSYINSYLFYRAFKNSISNALSGKDLGLGAQVFWQHYNSKFQEYFLPIKEQFLEDLKKTKNLTPKEKQKKYREMKLSKQIEFFKEHRLHLAIASYVKVHHTRSVSKGNVRRLEINSKLRPNLLHKIYTQFVQSDVYRNIDKIYLSIEFDLNNLNWENLGFNEQSDLNKVVQKYWIKYFKEKISLPIKNIVPVEAEFLQRYQKTSNINDSLDPENSQIEPQALVLSIKMGIDKILNDELLKIKKLRFASELLLYDPYTKTPIFFKEISPQTYQYETNDIKEFRKNLAGLIYRLPLEDFKTMGDHLREIPKYMIEKDLIVSNLKSIDDVFSFEQLLNLKGQKYLIQTQLVSHNGDQVKMKLRFQGQEKDLNNFIRSLDRSTLLETGIILSVPNKTEKNTYRVKMVQPKVKLQDANDQMNQGVSANT